MGRFLDFNPDSLQEVYDRLPTVDCKGKCHEQCTIIPVFNVEQKNIIREEQVTPPPGDQPGIVCDKLDRDTKRCRIYENRPLICRLFGAVADRKMKCPYGCKPDFWLTNEDVDELLEIVETMNEPN